ncbi:uncharacterized protein LOC111197588 [Astyanax mexicanus]|uniref:uncharacterized protein LOC111197588 n=1 Tax=Astyanax mexicanus TaxID=7994 RepID=UPI0020CB5960|nr:uncharacterized protein LOC111197588 [Astyanax mexicanus]
MASKGIKNDSPDSDDSMDGGRPSFSAEERELLHKLLKTSDEFLKHNEEHQPEIQGFIAQLKEKTDELLHLQSRLTKAVTVYAVSIIVAAFCFGIFLQDLLTNDDSWYIPVYTTVVGAVLGYIGYRIRIGRRKKSDWVKTVETIKGIAAQITDCLNNIYNLAEKILHCHGMFYVQHHQRQSLQYRTEAVSELVKLFRPDQLWKLLKEKNILDLKADVEKLGPPLHLITKEKWKTSETRHKKQKSRESKKKRTKQVMMQEESEAEQLDRKMRETDKKLKKLLSELRNSKEEVENRIVRKLNERFNQ